MADSLLRDFKPNRFRTFFLLGALWMAIAAIAAVGYAIHGVIIGSALQIGFNAGLAGVLLLAIRGLLRMRTWGLLLGALISVGLLALAPFYGATNAITLTLAAVPALLFWLAPVVLAQRKPQNRVRVESHYRIGEDASAAAAASLGEEEADEEPAEHAQLGSKQS